jgi:hypothetical protein
MVERQKWFSHNAQIPHQIILVTCFNKKKDRRWFPVYIPSEYEMIEILSKTME